MRWAMGLEYLGAAGVGWQAQAGGDGIADHFRRALRRLSVETGQIVAAGRTDSGVHACGQVVHLNLSEQRSPRAWMLGMNTCLPDSIRVRWARPVPEAFHARFAAQRRSYVYLLWNDETLSAFQRHRMAWERRALNTEAMRRAAAALIGERDFASFRSARCGSRTSVRQLHKLEVRRAGSVVWFEIAANAFLHKMCRVLVGSLWKVGLGQWPPERIEQILLARDRTQAGRTAPAEGLYFLGPDYPSEYALPPPVPAQQLYDRLVSPLSPETKIPVDHHC